MRKIMMTQRFAKDLISRTGAVTLLFLLFAFLQPSYGQTLHCDVQKKYGCEREACKDITNGSNDDNFHIIIDTAVSSYSRCEGRNCQTYSVTFSPSGIWLIANPTESTVFKIAIADSEIVTLL